MVCLRACVWGGISTDWGSFSITSGGTPRQRTSPEPPVLKTPEGPTVWRSQSQRSTPRCRVPLSRLALTFSVNGDMRPPDPSCGRGARCRNLQGRAQPSAGMGPPLLKVDPARRALPSRRSQETLRCVSCAVRYTRGLPLENPQFAPGGSSWTRRTDLSYLDMSSFCDPPAGAR